MSCLGPIHTQAVRLVAAAAAAVIELDQKERNENGANGHIGGTAKARVKSKFVSF